MDQCENCFDNGIFSCAGRHDRSINPCPHRRESTCKQCKAPNCWTGLQAIMLACPITAYDKKV